MASDHPSESAPPAGDDGSWWTRPCGGREVLSLALPLVISTAFWSLMLFVDRMFLLWYSQESMSAALPAGMTHWALICLPIGIASFVNSFVAQYHGARRPQQIGLIVAQGVWLGWVCTPLFLLAIPLAPWLFGDSVGDAVVREQVVYFQILALGGPATVIVSARSAFYTGRGLTRIVMLVEIGGTLVNIVLDYLLIFGKFGLPELGIAGAAWATVASHWFNAGVFWLLMRNRSERAEFGLDVNRFDAGLFWKLLKYGGPSGLPLLVEAFAFAMLTRYVAGLGVTAGAATSLAFNVNALAFVPVIGLGIAVSTLVGQRLGEGRPDLAARATWTAQVLGLIYTLAFGALYVFVPDAFMMAHAAFADPEEFREVRETTVILLRFVALYCLLDALQMVFVGALKGAGDTRFIFAATSIISVGSVIIGRWGQVNLGWGLYAWWWVITGWIFSLAAVYFCRFMLGPWREMSVIEPELAPGDSPEV